MASVTIQCGVNIREHRDKYMTRKLTFPALMIALSVFLTALTLSQTDIDASAAALIPDKQVDACLTTAPATPLEILVFYRTLGYEHPSIAQGRTMFKDVLAVTRNWNITETDDNTFFTINNLKSFDVVVFLSTTKNVLDSAEEIALQAFVEEGGGFVGIHSATDTEYDWDWYHSLVVSYFDNHPNDPNLREGVLTVEDPTHPAGVLLPSPWIRTEEWYNFRTNPRDTSGVNIILTVDETTYTGGEMGDDHPISWSHSNLGGRAFYTALGHAGSTFSNTDFVEHIQGGVEWAAGHCDPPPPVPTCPDGTDGNDVIVCAVAPPYGYNLDDTISAKGGNDTVILRDGASGGSDNKLPVDGGPGTDTLVFEFSNLSQNVITQIQNADPASGSVVIAGQTIEWVNFEVLQAPGAQPTSTSTPTPTSTSTPSDEATSESTETATPEGTGEPTSTASPPINEGETPTIVGDLDEGTILPTFVWPVQTGATWYQVVVINAEGLVVFGEWVENPCGNEGCNLPTSPDNLPGGLLNGEYTWWVGAYTPDQPELDWTQGTPFTVDVPPSQLFNNGVTIDPGKGRPVIQWSYDPGTTWVQFYVGNANTLAFLEWAAADGVCQGVTCTFKPETNPIAGDYAVWAQPWGPAGFLNTAFSGWQQVGSFDLPDEQPDPPQGLTVTREGGALNIHWDAAEWVTWYQIWIGTPAPDFATYYMNWLVADDLGCTDTPACVFSPEIDIAFPDDLIIYLRGWGPGGFTSAELEGGWIGPIEVGG